MKLSIFYTNNCNIICEHCFLGEQNEKHRMSNSMLKNILIQSKELEISTISFTGGEPLLYWNDIHKVLQTVNLKNKKLTVSTNAFWANTGEAADNMCLNLCENHITQLEVSCDEYHTKYIPIQNTINLINSAKKFGLSVKIVMSVSNDLSYLSIYSKLIKHISPERIIIQRVALFGNAKQNSINTNIDLEKFKGVKCNQVLNPCITYSGNIYACCGPCIVLGTNNVLYLTNINKESLKSAVNSMLKNNIIRQIYEQGPYSLNTEYEVVCGSSMCEFCIDCNWKMA